jgi:Tetratricopeptide repeat
VRRALAYLGLLALLGVAGCDGRRSSVTTPPSERDDDGALSTALLTALGQAKSYHHLADVHLADGDADAAAAALRQILVIRFPAGAPEGEETILDARARLAKLELARGRLDEARRVVDEGLAAPGRASFFLANLHNFSGELHEARAHALDGTDAAAARAERHAAIADYHQAIEIDERVQKALAKEARP